MSDNHLNTENQSQAPVFKWGAATHVGNVRTSNQDKYGIASNLLAVADGMGGHNGGEVAAEIAVTTLTASNGFQSISEFAYLVQMAHHLIQARAQENENLDGMGTTLCALSKIKYAGDLTSNWCCQCRRFKDISLYKQRTSPNFH